MFLQLRNNNLYSVGTDLCFSAPRFSLLCASMCLLLSCCVPLLYALMCLNVYFGASWCALMCTSVHLGVLRPSDVGFMQAGSHCICHLEVCNNNTLYLPPPQIAVSSSADISIRPAPPLNFSSLGFSSF